jgi:hypothetical protein
MTGIHKTIRKVVPKEWMKAHPIQDKVSKEGVRTRDSLSRRMNPELPPEEAPIPMADEEEIKRNKRKGQSARGGGRASTILTGGDQEALGG